VPDSAVEEGVAATGGPVMTEEGTATAEVPNRIHDEVGGGAPVHDADARRVSGSRDAP
jgi:hypothetical protein